MFDFMDRKDVPKGARDGSDELLREDLRVTEADRHDPDAGALRRIMDEIAREKR